MYSPNWLPYPIFTAKSINKMSISFFVILPQLLIYFVTIYLITPPSPFSLTLQLLLHLPTHCIVGGNSGLLDTSQPCHMTFLNSAPLQNAVTGALI